MSNYSNKKNPVYSVEKVNYAIQKTVPPVLLIDAQGQVNTGGWTGGELRPRGIENPSTEGILELDFVATPPNGPSDDGFHPITGRGEWSSDIESILGVTVYAETNKITEMFGETKGNALVSDGTFEGTSDQGDLNEALGNAATAAKEGLKSTLVKWKLEGVSGESGGFVDVRRITARIKAHKP